MEYHHNTHPSHFGMWLPSLPLPFPIFLPLPSLTKCKGILDVPELSAAVEGFAAFALLLVVLTLSLASRTSRSNQGKSNSLHMYNTEKSEFISHHLSSKFQYTVNFCGSPWFHDWDRSSKSTNHNGVQHFYRLN